MFVLTWMRWQVWFEQMLSVGQSSSTRQALAAPAAGEGAGVDAGGALACATRKGSRLLRAGAAAAAARSERNGSRPPARARAGVAPSTARTIRKCFAWRSAFTVRLLRGQHLPLAVFADECDFAGVALVALLAQHLQRRGLTLVRGALDLELGPLDLLLHLLDAALGL